MKNVTIKTSLHARRYENQRQYWAKTRIFLDIQEGTIDLGMDMPGYFREDGTGAFASQAEEDAAWKVYNKREVERMKMFTPFALAEAGLDPFTKVSWSRYAGCSCPCSPGFIVQGGITAKKGTTPADIWIEVAGIDVEEAKAA